ncbi:MAG: hydroxypyruvate isomerase [Bacteroidetes bacterium]|nr:MAG: hydroxypyruvate isomerase [Bacteroidota bacterium]
MSHTRRNFLKTAATAGLLPFVACLPQEGEEWAGKIRQVIAAWPFMNAGPKWQAAELVQHAIALGMAGVELLPFEHWHLLKAHGLVCAATRSHTFVRGMNNKNHHPECFEALEKAMQRTAAAGFPNVMTFTGLADTSNEPNGSLVSAEAGMKNCIDGYKKMARLAEKYGVSMVLEPLNSKVDEPMKGHPGYQGDHIAYCMEIIRAVSSPGLRLLFDVYHIQVMDGNLIHHIEQYAEYIGHVQIAGVPGRGEIGKQQEVNYKAVMKALLDNGYRGYVGHEWIPTGDALSGLKEAVAICDV